MRQIKPLSIKTPIFTHSGIRRQVKYAPKQLSSISYSALSLSGFYTGNGFRSATTDYFQYN